MSHTISLCMIVRDAEKYLPRLFDSIKGICDEIIVVDTGSKTDATKQIARSHGAKVFDWVDPEPGPYISDFSLARNFSFSKATCEFQSWLDADDVLLPVDREKFLALKNSLTADAYLMFYAYASDEFGNCTVGTSRHRIMRRGVATWQYPIHECLSFIPGVREVNTDIIITHRPDTYDNKGRNIYILDKALKKNPQDVRLRYYYAKELFNEGKIKECLVAFEKYFENPDWHDQINAFWYQAMSYCQLGQEDKAVEICMRAIGYDPRFAEFYSIIGQVHYGHQRWAQAISWFELASQRPVPQTTTTIQNDHYTWLQHDRLCVCYNAVGRVKEAYEENEKALKYRPTDAGRLANKNAFENLLFPGRILGRPIRLSLGSGGKFTPSYRCTDLFHGDIEEVFDQGKIPYPTASMHGIYSEHALEHCHGFTKAEEAIKEWARVLRHGGDLVLEVPDLEECCKQYVETAIPNQRRWFALTIYGSQNCCGQEHSEGQFHSLGYDQKQISNVLEYNGFKINSSKKSNKYGTPSIEIHATQIKQPMKVCWLLGKVDENNGSQRIRRLNVHKWLCEQGINSKIIEDYQNKDLWPQIKSADVVVMVGFSSLEKELIQYLHRCGVSVVYDHCEALFDLPYQNECFGAADVIVCCSTVLAEQSKHFGRTVVIYDAYEPGPIKTSYENKGKLKVYSACMGGNMAEVLSIKYIIEELGMQLVTMSEWPDHDILWKKETWLQELAKADIVLTIQRHWLQPCKSNTRTTQAMALGIPVCASPLKSYQEAITHSQDGYICSSPEDWRKYLGLLKDAGLRKKIGEEAKKTVAINYSIDAIGTSWLNLLEGLCKENCNPPPVDVVIPTWDNLPILQECIKAIKKNTDYPYKLIVVNSGTDGTKEWLAQQPDIVAINSEKRLHFSQANNLGIKAGKNDYVMLINDDTMPSIGWLDALMREAKKPGVGGVGPWSNCNLGWTHEEVLEVEGVKLVPSMTLDQVKPIIPQIYNLKHEKVVFEREWLAFYCILLSRKVIEEVGFLNENFKSGSEDFEWCQRAKAKGYKFIDTFDSVVFHLGAVSRKRAETENYQLYHDEDEQNHRLLDEKYRPIQQKQIMSPIKSKPKFVLYTGAAWESWSPQNLETGIGGSETCAIYYGKEFAKRGYDCYCFGDPGSMAGTYDGVKYINHNEIVEFVAKNEIDIFMSSRRAEVFALPIKARKKICVVHDIFLDPNPNADLHLDKVDKFFVLSPWHKSFFCSHHHVPEDKVYTTRDAIDLSRFDKSLPRERARLIYTSSPDRGLDVLLDILPRIQKVLPMATLHVAYGFDNWEKAVLVRKNQAEIQWMENIKKQLKRPGVYSLGRIGQTQLAEEMLKSELWAFPSYFTETFCITGAEMMAAGLPVITSNLAALSTTVGDAGILLNGDPRSEMYQNEFTTQCVEMLTNWGKWQEYSRRSKEKASKCGWEELIEDWVERLK